MEHTKFKLLKVALCASLAFVSLSRPGVPVSCILDEYKSYGTNKSVGSKQNNKKSDERICGKTKPINIDKSKTSELSKYINVEEEDIRKLFKFLKEPRKENEDKFLSLINSGELNSINGLLDHVKEILSLVQTEKLDKFINLLVKSEYVDIVKDYLRVRLKVSFADTSNVDEGQISTLSEKFVNLKDFFDLKNVDKLKGVIRNGSESKFELFCSSSAVSGLEEFKKRLPEFIDIMNLDNENNINEFKSVVSKNYWPLIDSIIKNKNKTGINDKSESDAKIKIVLSLDQIGDLGKFIDIDSLNTLVNNASLSGKCETLVNMIRNGELKSIQSLLEKKSELKNIVDKIGKDNFLSIIKDNFRDFVSNYIV